MLLFVEKAEVWLKQTCRVALLIRSVLCREKLHLRLYIISRVKSNELSGQQDMVYHIIWTSDGIS